VFTHTFNQKEGNAMKIKTNIRAGAGGASGVGGNSTGVDTSTSANSGGVNSNKPTKVVYVRCAGY
jgi:hypothetical protein